MAAVPETSSEARPARHEGAAQEDFDELIASLPEAQREVLVMLKVSGMTLEEVARATSSSVGAVKQKAHRAYVTLRRAMDKGRAADKND